MSSREQLVLNDKDYLVCFSITPKGEFREDFFMTILIDKEGICCLFTLFAAVIQMPLKKDVFLSFYPYKIEEIQEGKS